MPVTSPPRRVLFIDDDPGVRKTLASLLRKAGHDVAEAESGQAGLACFREQPVDIVLTDFRMPGCTGGEVARVVKALKPQVPVVYVTGYADEIPPSEQALAEAILEKPCGLSVLQTVIRVLTMPAADRPIAGPPGGQRVTESRSPLPVLPKSPHRPPTIETDAVLLDSRIADQVGPQTGRLAGRRGMLSPIHCLASHCPSWRDGGSCSSDTAVIIGADGGCVRLQWARTAGVPVTAPEYATLPLAADGSVPECPAEDPQVRTW